jgi:ATP-dependent Lon protease
VGYDLSKVMFVATANSLATIQPALRDRMEIIEINGYTLEEKVQIAKKHLLPKQLKEHGLKSSDLKIPNKVFESVIDGYTRESGVRGLDKMTAKLVRYAAKSIAMEQDYNKSLCVSDLKEILGAASFDKERQLNNDIPGVVTGLAWTAVGGDILFIESSKSPGKGKMSITGNLGNVMKESSTIALQYIKAHTKELNIKPEVLTSNDVHLHVPEGATPKDGPSAGITMLTALVSLFSGRKVKAKLAMTGEITLRGKVLPVGGIKEKILAAKRAGIKEIILCEQNKKDIDEINERYLKGLTFHYVSKMNDVIDLALI